MKNIFKLLIIIIVFYSCNNRSITNDNIKHIKETYSAKTINYFYELVFYSESENRFLDNIQKWDEKVKINILGNPKEEEIQAVNNVVESISKLNLSLDICFVENESDSNFKIHFKKSDNIAISDDYSNAGGICTVSQECGKIKNATIDIINRSDSDSKYNLFKVVEEEIIQGLGLMCDSHSYPNSLFYEARNIHKRFSNLDRDVLKLLYDTIIPINYGRDNFKQDFSDILIFCNTTEKIKKYIYQNKIKKDILEKIEGNCLYGREILVKQPENINVYIKGRYNDLDSMQISNTIISLNKICKNINLELHELDDEICGSGIHFDFINNQIQKDPTVVENTTYAGLTTMFPRIYKNIISFKYKNDLGSRTKINSSITETLFQCLVPLKKEDLTNKIKYEGDRVVFDKELKDIINVLYSDVFASGYKRSKFKKLIKDLN